MTKKSVYLHDRIVELEDYSDHESDYHYSPSLDEEWFTCPIDKLIQKLRDEENKLKAKGAKNIRLELSLEDDDWGYLDLSACLIGDK